MKLRTITLLMCSLMLVVACQNEIQDPDPQPRNPPAVIVPPSNARFVKVISDDLNGTPIVLVGRAILLEADDIAQDLNSNLVWDFAAAFESTLEDGTLLEFKGVDNKMPIALEDNEGNQWDIFGEAVSGPRTGQKLKPANAGIGFWFVFGAMYPGIEIFRGDNNVEKVDLKYADEWGIPTETVVRAAGLNGIPAINDPKFVLYETEPGEDVLPDDDGLVIGVNVNGEVKAYPHYVLDWHEIVNDVVGGVPITVSYCPLTGTAKVWDRTDHTSETFGVSGLLYNSNLLPFDFSTQSFWHQLEGRCVNGERLNEEIGVIPHIETDWRNWKTLFSETLVLTTETGFSRDYSQYPYGDYRTNNNFLISSIAFDDDRFQRKERVFAVIVNGEARVYPKDVFF